MLLRLSLATVVVLGIIYIVPLVLYGVSSRFVSLPAPDSVGAARFLAGVFVTKLGTAIAFVALYWVARGAWQATWLAYAGIWFVMFAASEVGEAISGRTSVPEALIGILSEAAYAPLAAWATQALLA